MVNHAVTQDETHKKAKPCCQQSKLGDEGWSCCQQRGAAEAIFVSCHLLAVVNRPDGEWKTQTEQCDSDDQGQGAVEGSCDSR